MKSLRFSQLELLSSSKELGGRFEFQPRLNLITGVDNDVGKSSLVKSILWVLGCEPSFDDDWISIDCKGIVDFTVDDIRYSVARYKDQLYLKKSDGEYKKYTRVTGEYSDVFSEIVRFNALLPARPKEGEVPRLETPPPAYYFLPYYLDQKKTWSHPWAGFKNLGQYANWQKTIIKYHAGYLSDEHFQIEESIYDAKVLETENNFEIERIDNALAVVNKYFDESNVDFSDEFFEAAKSEIDIDLAALCNEQELLLQKLSELRGEEQYLLNQLGYARHAANEIELDYIFSVENLETDHLECPVCGTEHDNSVISRSSLLADEQKLKSQADDLQIEYRSTLTALNETESRLNSIRQEIDYIEGKYSKEGIGQDYANLIDTISSRQVKQRVSVVLHDKHSDAKRYSDTLKNLKGRQRKLLNKNEREKLDSDFTELMVKYINDLNATRVNLSRINKPTDYNKVYDNGGAAHNSRAVLAYYLALYSHMRKHGSCVRAPLIIDTPNQHEQSDINYESIISVLTEDKLGDGQIFLCAMDNQALKPFAQYANVITLDKEQLFSKSRFHEVRERFESVFS